LTRKQKTRCDKRLCFGYPWPQLPSITGDYRQGLLPLIVPLTLLKHHLNRNPVPEWVHQQVYLHPYPKELMLRNHVWCMRSFTHVGQSPGPDVGLAGAKQNRSLVDGSGFWLYSGLNAASRRREATVIRTVEAVIDEHGQVSLLESVQLAAVRRALVTILEEEPALRVPETALLSEPALAEDWNKPEEDAASLHLQSAR
jgi:hypothetical protein